MHLTRRGLITGVAALVAAPALVRAESLMPVRGIIMDAGLDWARPALTGLESNGYLYADVLRLTIWPPTRFLLAASNPAR